jgi:prolyl-tRNA synthetase
VERFHDDNGIMWPASVAPMQVHLLALGDAPEVVKEAERVYGALQKEGVEVLYDDRTGPTPGAKFADADLIGIPWRVVISEKTVAKGKLEAKRREEKEGTLVTEKELIKLVSGNA